MDLENCAYSCKNAGYAPAYKFLPNPPDEFFNSDVLSERKTACEFRQSVLFWKQSNIVGDQFHLHGRNDVIDKE